MKKYISSLDGLRGFGIIFVVLYHLLRLKGANPTLLGFSWIFIQMFFVQSGYLITKILLQNKTLPLREYLKRFYWNRVVRIFPVYFLYLFILVGIYLAFNITPDFPSRAAYLFTYTYNFTRLFENADFHPLYVHLWSLAVEEQFYLVWPFFFYFLSSRKIKTFIISLILLCPLVRYALGEYLVSHTHFDEMRIGEAIYGFTLSHFDAFAIGGSIAIFPFNWLKARIKIVLLLFSLLGGVLLFLNQYSISGNTIDLSWTSLGIPLASLHNYQHVWSYTLVNLLFFLMIMLITENKYQGIFNWAPFVSMGKVVYGTYIFHFALLLILTRVATGLWFPLLFIISLAGAYIIGRLSYHFFEKRFLRYKY